MQDSEYHGDDPDRAAKKAAKDLKKEGWHLIKGKVKDDNNNSPRPKAYNAYKYSKDISLAEEITLGSKNVLLQIINGEPEVRPELNLKDQNIIIKPHDKSENTPIIPYSFKDIDEIKYFIEQRIMIL